MGGTHRACFQMKRIKSLYFDSFGGNPNNFIVSQLPKPLLYHNYIIRDKTFRLCGTNCPYFFYLLEVTQYYDAILKLSFFSQIDLPMNIFGNRSSSHDIKIATRFFVQQLHFRTNYIESFFKQVFDMKNQYRINIKKIEFPSDKQLHVDILFNDPPIIKKH